MEKDDILDLPIRNVVDGWSIKRDGQEYLYLWVEVSPNVVHTILIPRK